MLHSVRTYRKTGGIDFRFGRRYVCTQRLTLLPHIFVEALHADKVVVPILGTTKTDRKRSDFIGIF